MRKSAAISAGLWAAIFAAALFAQPRQDQGALWREKMKAAEDAEESPASLMEALKVAESFGETDPRLFETVIRLADVCEYANCDPKGSDYLDRALKMRANVQPADAHFADLLMKLGSCASESGRTRDSLLVYGEALKIREKLFGENDQRVARTYAATAWVYLQTKDPAQARRTMQHALEIRQGAAETAEFAALLDDSAWLYVRQRDFAAGEKEYAHAMSIRERLWKPSDPRFIKSLRDIANRNQWDGDKALAEGFFRRIADIQKTAHTVRSDEYYDALTDLGELLRTEKRLADAETVFQDAFLTRRKKDLKAAVAMQDVARCRLDRGLYKEAADAAEISLALRALFEKAPATGTLVLQGLLADAYLQAHDPVKSEAAFRTLNEKAGSDNRYILIGAAEKLSTIYQERGDYPRAAEKLEVAVAAIEATDSADRRLPDHLIRLAGLYQAMGRAADANRMNIAAMRAIGNTLSKENHVSVNRILIVVFAFLLVLPFVGSGVCGLIYWLCARSIDRKLALLYQSPEIQRAVMVEPSVTAEANGAAAVPPEIACEVPPEAAAALVIAPPIEETLPLPVPQAEPPASPTLPTESEQRVSVRAEGSVLFAMRVLNLLLSLLTLGVYSFWGKAKVRRYVCGQAEFQGDWFVFHGTGRELLVGWLRALPALAFIFLFPYILPLVWQHKFSPWVAQLCALAAFLVLWPVARVGAYRYRLNRMSWRGIRFSYRGKAFRFLMASLLGGFLTVITLGIYAPFLQVRLRRLLFEKTYFGDGVFQFSGRGRHLSVAWLFALPLGVCSLGIGWAWWSALRHRYYWAHTTFAGSRFRCTATGAKLLWLWIGNLLIIVPTIGLGMSWAMLRTLRFWTRHICLVGEPGLAAIRQDERTTTAMGESFADFLGFDFGF